MTNRYRNYFTVIAVGGLAVLAGCSGSGDGPPKTAEASEAAVSGPLDQYRMEVQSILGSSEATWKKQQQKIVACMSEQGFDYLAIPYQPSPDTGATDAQIAAHSRPEYYTKYGYGIFTDQTVSAQPSPTQPADPNEPLTSAMSGPEYAAYTTALYGAGPPADQPRREKGDTDTSWQYAGCTGKAEHEVTGGPGSEQDPDFETLRKQMVAFEEDMWEGSGLKALNTRWTTCMKDAGYADERLAAPADAPTYVFDNGSVSGKTDKQLREFELAVAKADYGCRDNVDYEAQSVKIQHDAQAQFVAEHKAELDAWVKAAREGAGDTGDTA